MDILKWAENELKREGCEGLEYVSEAFRALVGDERPGWDIQQEADVLVRLANRLPLTPIEEDEFVKAATYEDGMTAHICTRYERLTRYEKPDGTVCYDEYGRFDYFDIESGQRVAAPDHFVNRFLNRDIFPITMPYYPMGENIRVFIKRFRLTKDWAADTVGLYYAEKPDGTEVEIERFFKYSKKKADWVEISYIEYILREAMAMD